MKNDELGIHHLKNLEKVTNIICKCDTKVVLKTNIEPLKNSIWGFAVKLSWLEKFKVNIQNLFDLSKKNILIDAEAERLDNWIIDRLKHKQINKYQLKRLYITVQVKRKDAREQIKKLIEMGVNLILVSGNNAYLNEHERKVNAIDEFAKYLSEFSNLAYLGIGFKTKRKIESILGYKINDAKIIELYGYQQLEGSKIWAFYSSSVLSKAALDFVKRRGNSTKDSVSRFIIQNQWDLVSIAKKHSLILYVDGCSAFHLLFLILQLSEIGNHD